LPSSTLPHVMNRRISRIGALSAYSYLSDRPPSIFIGRILKD
jgi:hypothetical protein